MPDSQSEPWFDNPNTPRIPYAVFSAEKTWFAGSLLCSILYGMLIVLFFKCMIALLYPVYRRGEGIKWGLVSYTVIMFSLVTVRVAVGLHVLSISYIDNRNFPGVEGKSSPGPYGYQASTSYKAFRVISSAAFYLNNWAADGLLLYRCYIFYSMNLWVVAFPFLVYLSSVAMGILAGRPIRRWGTSMSHAQLSLSLSLNVLLTFMIVIRLVLHGRSIRAATGSPAGISGLYKTIATMLIESSAISAVSSLLVMVPWALSDPVANVFVHILTETQVIASLLIIQRVANKSALTSDTIAPRSISPFKATSKGGLTGGGSSLPGGYYPMSSVGKHGKSSGELGVGAETVIHIRRDRI